MNKEERIKEIAKDIPFLELEREVFVSLDRKEKHAWTLSEDDNKQIAQVLIEKGYRKTIWHKIADRDFPPTNKKVLFKLVEYDELTVGFLREDGLFDLESYSAFFATDADVIAWTELPIYTE